ncbi:MAG TPA: hypothetical protein PLO43_02900 [Chlamydiales bacterium]|nr:hypothetical protein [Chlamydiales bacterium]
MSKHMGSGPGGQRPIEGYRQQEKEKNIEEPPPDDEFKKIMQVESATEAPQKRKRRDDEGSEEIEGLNIPERTLENPLHKEPSPLEIQAPKSLKKETYSGQKHAEMVFLPQTEALESPSSFMEEVPESQPSPTVPAPTVRPPASSEVQAAPPTTSQIEQPVQPQQIVQAPQKQQPTTTQPDQQTQNQNSQSQPQKSSTPTASKETTPTPQIKIPEEASTAKHSTQLPLPPEPKKSDKPAAKKGAPKSANKVEETHATKAPPEETTKIQKEKYQKDQAEKVAESGGVLSTQTPDHLPGALPTAETTPPSYLNLPPAVFELFDRMVSYITIAHSKTGEMTATVHIDLKGSVFNGAKLELKRVPTAPNTFNIQLQGTPEAVQLFNANAQDLAAAFQFGKYAFDVNIQRASLLEEHRAKIRRVTKKSDTEKGT